MLDVLESWELGKNLHSRIKYKKWIRFFFWLYGSSSKCSANFLKTYKQEFRAYTF